MQWIRRILMVVGALTIIYMLVAFGRRTAGVKIDPWGDNPTSSYQQPAGPPIVFPLAEIFPAAPPAPPQPPPIQPVSRRRNHRSTELTDEELAENYAVAVRRGRIPD